MVTSLLIGVRKRNEQYVFSVVQNLCLKAGQACKGQRVFTAPRVGVAEDKVAQYAGLHYYTDKELQVSASPIRTLTSRVKLKFSTRKKIDFDVL